MKNNQPIQANQSRPNTMKTDKSATCPCGQGVNVPILDNGEYQVINLKCPACGRTSTGGNYRQGTVDHWITPKDAAQSQAEYERQLFSAEMNEFEGRGNHCF